MPADTYRCGALAKRAVHPRPRALTRNDDDYLFRSPVNAERLMRAYNDSLAGKGQRFTIEQLREELGLGEG